MKYKTLFNIEIVNEYFKEGIGDMVILPVEETKKRIEAGHFLIKKSTQGISVLLADTLGGIDEIMEFYVFPTAAAIREVTTLPEVDSEEMLLFSNENIDTEIVNLTESRIEEEAVFNGYKSIAKIKIDTNNISGEGVEYQVHLKAKSIKWKYYLISKLSDKSLMIKSRNEQFSFKEVVVENTSLDTRVANLKLNFPDAQIKIFESNDEIPFRQKPIKDIRLLQDEEQLIKHLPNPRITDLGIQILKIM